MIPELKLDSPSPCLSALDKTLTSNEQGLGSSRQYPRRIIKSIAVISIALSLLLISNSCFNRKKSGGQSGSSAPVPGAFQTTLPADGVINVNVFSAPVPVAWNSSSNVTSYILEVAKEDDFTPANMIYSTTLGPNTTSHSVPFGLLWGGIWYYWRVTAVNAYGTTVSSDEPSCFYTSSGGTIPGAFNLSTPADNAYGLSLAPELNWTNATKESKYIIYLDNDYNFSSPLYTDTARPGELNIQIPAEAGLTETSRYYWKVNAYNPFGTRSSSTYSFVTGPINSYTITPTATTITAGQGVTMTITAYNSSNAVVTSHGPFTLTMNSGAGLTYYTNSSLTIINSTGTYTMTNGTSIIYVKITAVGSVTITATDRAGLTKASPAITVNAAPIAAVVVSGPSPINSGIEYSYTAVSYDINNNVMPDTYTWSKTNGTGSATLNLDKLTGVYSGTVTITATSVSAPTKSAGQTVTVLPGAIAAITVSGSTPITSGVQTSSYTAVSKDATGNTVSDTYTWSNANGTGSATRSNDKLTGISAGTVIITATSVSTPSKSGGKTVTVVPNEIVSVTVSTPTGSISSGVEYTCTAASKDINNNTVTDTHIWTKSDGTGTANLVTNKLTGMSLGTVTITATSFSAPTKSAGVVVTVVPGPVATITVSGPDPITSGVETSSYTAVSKDINDNTVSDTYIWSKANGTGSATLNGDKLTGIEIGTVLITATSNTTPTTSGGKTVTVLPGAIVSVTVTGSDPISSGVQSPPYIARSKDINNNMVPDTHTWTKSDDTGTADLVVNRLTGMLVGTVIITATSNADPAKSVGKTVTIVPGPVATVIVSGENTITSGIQSSPYTAVSYDGGGNMITEPYTWSVANNGGSANINEDKLTGILAGPVIITATSTSAPTKSGGQAVTVVPGGIVAVAVTAPAGSIPSGVEYTCTAASKDINNNTVTDTHTWAKSDGTGMATFNVDKLTGILPGTVTITATSDSVPTKSDAQTVTVIPGAISYYTVLPSSSSVISWSPQSAVLIAKDVNGNTVPDFSTVITITALTVTPTPNVTFYTNSSYITTTGAYTLNNGSATVYYRARHDGSGPDGFTIKAQDGNNKEGASSTVTVNILTGPANKLLWAAQPTTPQTAGSSWSAFSIEVADTYGNRCITDSSTVVTVVTASGSSGFTGGYTATASSGLATFSALKYNKAEFITIRGTSGSLTPTASSGITINPAPAGNLAFVQQPTSVTVGSIILPSVTVRVRDAYNNIVPAAQVLISTTNGTFLNGATTRTSDGAGIASFGNLSMNQAGAYALSATALSGAVSATSIAFNIFSTTADNMIFVQHPTDTPAGQNISPAVTVRVRDEFNNPVPDITVILATTNGTEMSGTLIQISGADGIAAFNDLNITLAGTYALSASSGGLTTITSDNFTINPANATKLLWVTQPASPQTAGNPWTSFSVEIMDQYNNRVITNANVTVVTVTGTSGFASGSTVAASSGVATFTAATYNRAETITVRAISGALAPTENSNSITINPASPNHLTFIQPPTNAVSGAAFSPIVTVIIRDLYDNNIPTATNPVSLTVSAGSTLGGTTGIPAINGVATFTGVTISGNGANRVLTATSTGLTLATSNPFSVTAYGTASNLTFSQQPSDTISGSIISPAVTIRVTDQYGNPVSNTAVSITTTNGTAMAGTLTQNSGADGATTFSNLSINQVGNGYVLSATALSGAINTTSSAFNINATAGAPTVTTNPAVSITYNSAVLSGTVNPAGYATQAWFEWGLTTSYGNSTTPQDAGNGMSNIVISDTISSLVVSTTYYFRVVAQNGSGTSYGTPQTFTTTLPDYRGSGGDGVLNITSGTFNINTQTQQGGRSGAPDAVSWTINANIPSGGVTISSTIARPAGFAVNDEVIIINLQGTPSDYSNVGLYEFNRIIALPDANSITLVSPLSNTYNGTTQRIIVQRVPNYTNVTVSGTAATYLTCNGWNGTTGGVLAFRATGTVTTKSNGYINASGIGHRGGAGAAYNANSYAGESYIRASYASGGTATSSSATDGLNQNPGGGGGGAGYSDISTISYTANGAAGTTGPVGGGGGGSYNNWSYYIYGGGGGGGGYGSEGTTRGLGWPGSGSSGGAGGSGNTYDGAPYGGDAGGGGLYGNSSQLNTRAYFGAGGGAGGGVWAYDIDIGFTNFNGTAGGSGGGFMFIGANVISSTGYIIANGGSSASFDGSGGDGFTFSAPGIGGGGAGGSIVLRVNAITNSGIISANGGASGGDGWGNYGGQGGQGRIYLEYTTYPGYRGSGVDGPLTVAAVPGTFNINTNSSGGRSQPDAWNSRVSSLITNTAILVTTPPSGALSPGDEVILISLKGAPTAYVNVGNYEFLRVIAVTDTFITFAWPKIRYYGDTADSDANVGSTQFVMLQRVPNYTNVSVPWGTVLTCNAWNGATGGVVAFRANGTVSVGSTATPTSNRTAFISAYGAGLRGGTGTTWNAYAPAGETYFGGLYSSGARAGSFTSYDGVNTPNPGGGGGGSSSSDGAVSTIGSNGTTGPAGGGGGAAKSAGYYCLAGGGGGGGYGSVGQPGDGSISATITATAGSGTTGGRGGDRLVDTWTPESGGGGGGGTYGDSTQMNVRAYLGAGGGAGGGAECASDGNQLGGSGGTGGGFIFIGANTINIYYNINGSYTDYGYIYAGGLAGSNSTSANRSNPGGGGGGAGGSVVIKANSITNQNVYGIATFGGTGGVATYYSGGVGGDGRAYIQYNTFSGSNPVPGYYFGGAPTD